MSTKKQSSPKKSKAVKSLADIPSEVVAPEETPQRLKQAEIPGTERPVIRELEDAAELYVNLRDKMQTAVKEFKEKGKTLLMQLMHKHTDKLNTAGTGELVYTYSDMQVILKRTDEKLQVKHIDPDEEISVGEAPEDKSEGEV